MAQLVLIVGLFRLSVSINRDDKGKLFALVSHDVYSCPILSIELPNGAVW